MLLLEGSLTVWNPSAMQRKRLLLWDRIVLILSCYTCLFHCCICPYFCTFCMFCIIYVGNVWCFYVNSVRFNHVDCSYHFLFNYRGVNLSFLKLAEILINEDIESNPRPTQSNCKCPHGWPKKIKVFKGTPKIIVRRLVLMLLVIQKYKIYF